LNYDSEHIPPGLTVGGFNFQMSVLLVLTGSLAFLTGSDILVLQHTKRLLENAGKQNVEKVMIESILFIGLP